MRPISGGNHRGVQVRASGHIGREGNVDRAIEGDVRGAVHNDVQVRGHAEVAHRDVTFDYFDAPQEFLDEPRFSPPLSKRAKRRFIQQLARPVCRGARATATNQQHQAGLGQRRQHALHQRRADKPRRTGDKNPLARERLRD